MKDKQGNKLTLSEFFQRWGKGIKQVATNPTPLEKLSIELRATFINLIGITTCLTALIIFREQFFVSWFAYGLILIFISTLVTTGLKFFGLKEQKKFLKSLEINSEVKEEKLGKENKPKSGNTSCKCKHCLLNKHKKVIVDDVIKDIGGN